MCTYFYIQTSYVRTCTRMHYMHVSEPQSLLVFVPLDTLQVSGRLGGNPLISAGVWANDRLFLAVCEVGSPLPGYKGFSVLQCFGISCRCVIPTFHIEARSEVRFCVSSLNPVNPKPCKSLRRPKPASAPVKLLLKLTGKVQPDSPQLIVAVAE